jgi:hypothetical protein
MAHITPLKAVPRSINEKNGEGAGGSIEYGAGDFSWQHPIPAGGFHGGCNEKYPKTDILQTEGLS